MTNATTEMAIQPQTRPTQPSAAPADSDLRLIVSIPALNEEATIAEVVRAIPRQIPGIARIDILVVDDGSTDQTARLAREAGAEIIHHHRSRGVGAAFQSALALGIERGADLIASIDADGQFDPRDIPRLVEPIIAGRADFTTASRFKDPALTPQMPAVKRWGNAMMSRLISRLTGQTFHDVSCGMRCYNRRAAVSLNLLGRFTYTQEVFLNLAFKHFQIEEVPITVRGVRAHGESRVASNLFRYAVRTSRIILRCYRDYHPMRFFGWLSAALAAPAILLALFLLSHYLSTGTLSPHKWAGFSSAALGALSLLLLFVGMIGDMLNRHRIYLEELLYLHRIRPRDDD